MAIQRVPGQMLEANLTRSSDLAFQTDLLYLDVSNNRVGIKTNAPGNFALDVNGTARFQDNVTISGNLTVTGETTVVNTTNMEIEDNILVLNSGGSTGNDAGLMINRGGVGDNAVFYWDEVDDKFKFVITPSDGSTVTSINDSTLARIAVATPVDSDDAVTKNYVDTAVSGVGNSFNIADDGSTTSNVLLNDTLQFLGGNNIATTVSGNTVTFTGAKDININSITSDDSTAIQINDGLNVAGATTVNNTLNVTGAATLGTSLTLPTGATVTAILDEDTMSSNSDTALATQQSIKAYVDSSATTINNNADNRIITGSASAGTLEAESAFTFNGTDVTIPRRLVHDGDSDTYIGFDGANYLTASVGGTLVFESTSTNTNFIGTTVNITNNLNIDGNLNVNSISSDDSTAIQINDGLNVAGNIDVQGNTVTGLATPSADSDAATKAYVDTQVSASNSLTIGGDDSSEITLDLDTTLNTVGTGGISTTVAGDTLTINLTNTGVVASTYGSSTEIPQITVDAQGRVTNIGTNTISTTLTVSDDTSTEASIALGTDSLQILGGNNISTQISGSTITLVGATDINVNTITSTDSSAIQVNDHLNVAGNINIVGTITATGDGTFEDVRVRGNLTVDGTQTILNTETLSIEDNIIVLNRNVSGTPVADAGIEINRGDEASKSLLWNESTDKWTVGSDTFVAGTFEGNLTGNADTATSMANVITIVGDDSTGTTLNSGETIKIAGGTGITTSVTGDTLTIEGVNQAQGISFGDNTSSTISIPDGNTLNVVGTGGLVATVLGDTLTIDGSGVVADLGTFTFSGNKLTQTASDGDFEMDMSGSGNFVMLGTSALKLPAGTTAERPSHSGTKAGEIRYNSDLKKYEVSEDGASWTQINTGLDKPTDNTVVQTLEYNKLTTASTVVDEFNQFEYAGAFYHISIEDISNNLVGQININLVRSDTNVYHAVYDKNEDSTNLVSWSTNIDGNNIQLVAQANAESSHVNLKIQRVGIGYYERTHLFTNSKTFRTNNLTSTPTTIDTFPTEFTDGVKYYSVFRDVINQEYEVRELLLVHDGTTAYITDYGHVSTTASQLVTYTASYANGTVTLSGSTTSGQGTLILYRMDFGLITNIGTYNNITYSTLGDVDATNITTVDEFEIASRKTAKYIINLHNSDSNVVQMSEISLIHNGSTASFSEVSVDSGSTIGNFSADVSGGKVRLRFQGSGYNNTRLVFARFDYETPLFYKANADTTGSIYASGSGALHLPSGTTAQRPSPTPGVIRFNTTTSQYEVSVDGSSWQALKTQSYTRAVTKDVFAGDGSTQTFTSANVATDAENLLVYIDGVIQEPDINYTINIPASTITITDEAPHSGARVVVIRGFAEDVALS